MKGHNIREIKRSKWEKEMYIKLYEQKLENERAKRITWILNIAAFTIVLLGILGVMFINYKFDYLL